MINSKIKREYLNIFEYARKNLFLVGLFGSVGFPLYYFIWEYMYPQPYENLPLRIFCSLLVVPWMFYEFLPDKAKKIFPHYFFITIFVCLPFFFCFMMFANSFSEVWVMSFLTAMYLAIIMLYNWVLIILMIVSAIVINYIIFSFFWMHGIGISGFSLTDFDLKYIPIFFFALASGIVCNYRNELGSQFKIKSMKSLGGGVAHEMRNPLNAINLLVERIKKILGTSNSNIEERDIKEINKTVKTIENCTSRANEVINIILSNLKEEKQSENLELLLVNDIVTQSVKEYGYNDEEEKDKVILDIDKNFIIKAEKTAFIYIIFNLIKNALYYLNSFPDSRVTVSTKKGGADDDYNQIIVRDTGPGIEKEKIKSIFKSFYTSGKSEGTGLGLDFCKRTMDSFNGKIECESELGEYTEFILSFPKVSEEEELSDSNKEKIERPLKLMLVDDQEAILKIVKKSISNHVQGVIIDTASNGNEAVKALKRNNYDIVLMDIEMPVMGGIEASKEIRKFNEEIPILGYTSSEESRNKAITAGMNGYVLKSESVEILIRNICKWNLINHIPKITKTKVSDNKKKKILLADDQPVNRMILKKNLEEKDLEVDCVQNGEELVEKYIEQVSKGQLYDAIIADIHMPIVDGFEATKKIFEYNKENNIEFIVPIIAYSGDTDKKDVYEYLNAGMTDYFAKGGSIDYLVDMIDFWSSRPSS